LRAQERSPEALLNRLLLFLLFFFVVFVFLLGAEAVCAEGRGGKVLRLQRRRWLEEAGHEEAPPQGVVKGVARKAAAGRRECRELGSPAEAHHEEKHFARQLIHHLHQTLVELKNKLKKTI
jgi:hypothetical protein